MGGREQRPPTATDLGIDQGATTYMKTNVTFPSAGLKLAGILFTPDAHTGSPLPAIVVSHPGGGVKEQTASIYAERLAREGYATLVFDAAYQDRKSTRLNSSH